MNAARPENSKRLLRVLGVLADGQEHSTLDLIAQAKVCAVNSCIAELRVAGHEIECKRHGDIWRYRLIRRSPTLAGSHTESGAVGAPEHMEAA